MRLHIFINVIKIHPAHEFVACQLFRDHEYSSLDAFPATEYMHHCAPANNYLCQLMWILQTRGKVWFQKRAEACAEGVDELLHFTPMWSLNRYVRLWLFDCFQNRLWIAMLLWEPFLKSCITNYLLHNFDMLFRSFPQRVPSRWVPLQLSRALRELPESPCRSWTKNSQNCSTLASLGKGEGAQMKEGSWSA